MRKLDIGTGRANFEDYETLDNDPKVGAKWCLDIEQAFDDEKIMTPFQEQFDEIRASHILEHILPQHRVKVMATLHAWLKPGGILEIEVPIAGTQQFYQDPTHLCPWHPSTFWYFTKGNNFGESFAKRYSQYPVPLMERLEETTNDWRFNIKFKKI